MLWKSFQANKLTHNGASLSPFDLYKPYWTDHAKEEVNTHTLTHTNVCLVRQPLCAQVNALAAVSTSVLCLIGPFAVQSHLSRKPLLPLITMPFAQAAGWLPAYLLTSVCLSACLPLGCGSCCDFLGYNMFLGLEEGRLCSSVCRPEMQIPPLFRTLAVIFCPL